MKFDYCPKCGEKLLPKQIGDEGDVPYCGKCERPFFPFSYPCVICLCIAEDGDVLLIKQSYGIIRYVCVAGYIKSGEDAETAARREIAEETGLETLGVRFLYSRYYEKHDNLMLAFACRVRKSDLTLSGEVSDAAWFTPEEAEKALFEGAYGIDMLHEVKRLQNGGLLGI
ncbi:MAG: NUDIX domain-containing protein [Ruminiclostridium sp.]|nr:NUDIX domain-containing protein [Ruminiclostridium sp.]